MIQAFASCSTNLIQSSCSYDDSVLLQVLDGSDTKGKHMILFTCNDDDEISEYLIDRCSRIRYWREFDEMSPSLIMEVLNDKLNDEEVKSLTDLSRTTSKYVVLII